jgi:chromosome segregation ATPase
VQEAEEERKRKAHEMEEAERERKAEEMARKKRKKAELLEEFKSTKSEMDELKAQLTSQTETINQLQQTNASLQMQLGAQQSRIAELDAVNREWDVRFKALAEATVPKLTFASVWQNIPEACVVVARKQTAHALCFVIICAPTIGAA